MSSITVNTLKVDKLTFSDGTLLTTSSASSTKVIRANFTDNLVPIVGTIRWYPESPSKVYRVYASVGTVGTTVTEFDIFKNGVSILSPKLAILANQNISEKMTLSVNMTENDYLTASILTAGTGAQNAVVYIMYSS
jgi:hypothetical protein